MTNENNAAQAAEQEIREAFELTYAADADDPACAADLFHFTNGWRACIMSQVRAPVTDEPPGGTHWPVLRAMARNYTAGKHTWDALDANACEQAAEEIRRLRAALASAPVASARAALAQLEAACDTLCRLRTQEQYLSMVDSGQQDALLALDDARAQARAALASAPAANDLTPAGMKEICPECGHQFGCFHSPYIDKLRALASAPVAGEAQGWSGWACQYPNKLPRLYGSKEIALLNCDAANGDRVLFLSEHAAPQASAEYERGHADGWAAGWDQAIKQPQADKDGGQQRAGDVLPDYMHDLRYHDQFRIGWNRCVDAYRSALSATQAGQGDTREA